MTCSLERLWNRWWLFPYMVVALARLFLERLVIRWWMLPYVIVVLALLFLEGLWNRK